jgi:hypothetical protein
MPRSFAILASVTLILAAGCSGPASSTGPKGDTGAQGPAGPPGASNVISAAAPLSLVDGGLSIATASSTSDGALSATDFSHFSAKVDSVSAGSGLVSSGTAQAVQLAVDFGTGASQAVRGDDARLSDARSPLPGSANYLQNGVTPQAASFAITGSGVIGGALSVAGNLAVGGALAGDGSLLTNVAHPGDSAVSFAGAVSAASLTASGAVTAASFSGNGSGLSNVTASALSQASSDPACNASTAGALYFNTADHTIRSCNGSSFVVIGPPGTYCGVSSSATTGAISTAGTTDGYQAAKALCETTCNTPAAHMCSSEEWIRSRQLGVWPSGFGGGVPWISGGLAFATAGAGQVNDCAGWTTAAATVSGPVGNLAAPLTQTCDTSRPVACCL